MKIRVVACSSMVAMLASCNGTEQLDNSMEQLGKRAGFEFQTREMVDYGSITDRAAIWRLQIESLDEMKLARAGIRPARFEDDIQYFRVVVKQRFPSDSDLEKYRLWRGGIVLGQGTICDQNHCNVYVLYDAQSGEAFVEISRT